MLIVPFDFATHAKFFDGILYMTEKIYMQSQSQKQDKLQDNLG